MVQDGINLWATFRYALAYPEESHLVFFRSLFGAAPSDLQELRSLYIELFEAGLPHPRCPLLESYYMLNRPPGEIVLENKLFYRHFGLFPDSKAAPDHLLTQLEFLAWLDYCLASGNPEAGSLQRARREYLERHLAPWLPKAAHLASEHGGACYPDLLQCLSDLVAGLQAEGNDPAERR
jgi:DMSO reductase family type II enzyme chaperone